MKKILLVLVIIALSSCQTQQIQEKKLEIIFKKYPKKYISLSMLDGNSGFIGKDEKGNVYYIKVTNISPEVKSFLVHQAQKCGSKYKYSGSESFGD